jgi:hypothetical protein
MERMAAQEVRSLPLIVDTVLRTPGRPLDATLRAGMERRFSQDFSRVRLHADADAVRCAHLLKMNAFTVGNDIVLGAGGLRPATVAHELAHVVQQGGGGGAPPGPAHERDAEAAAHSVESGSRPIVRTRSQPGLAAERKGQFPGESLLAGRDPALGDVTTVDYAEIEAVVNKVIQSPGAKVHEGRRDFSVSPRVARANMYQSHFRDDQERLSYALGVLQASSMGGPIDSSELFATMVRFAVQSQSRAEVVVHAPPTAAELAQVSAVRAQHEQAEFAAYLREVKELEAEARKRTLVGSGGVYSGAATLGPVEYYVGEPIKALAQGFVQIDTRHMVSLMINFIPVVGQIKAVAEAIVGFDLVTFDDLATWERGLNLLLAIIPEAKGIFSTGRAGLRTLASVARDSGMAADEVYRTAKLASRLSVEEVSAVEKLAVGGQPTARQVNLAKQLDELPGVAGTSAAESEAALKATPARELPARELEEAAGEQTEMVTAKRGRKSKGGRGSKGPEPSAKGPEPGVKASERAHEPPKAVKGAAPATAAKKAPEVIDQELVGFGPKGPRYQPAPAQGVDPYQNYVGARDSGIRSAGLSGDQVPHLVESVGPGNAHLVGRPNGYMSLDGSRGWRLDYSPGKGGHINWWRVESGVLYQGSTSIAGANEATFFKLLQGHFGGSVP